MEWYKVRMCAEYLELCSKYKKLINMLRDADIGALNFELNCPIELLKEQADVMKRYIDILIKRSTYEHIDLPKFNFYIEGGERYGE